MNLFLVLAVVSWIPRAWLLLPFLRRPVDKYISLHIVIDRGKPEEEEFKETFPPQKWISQLPTTNSQIYRFVLFGVAHLIAILLFCYGLENP